VNLIAAAPLCGPDNIVVVVTVSCDRNLRASVGVIVNLIAAAPLCCPGDIVVVVTVSCDRNLRASVGVLLNLIAAAPLCCPGELVVVVTVYSDRLHKRWHSLERPLWNQILPEQLIADSL